MNAEQKKFYLTLGLCVTLFSFMACSKGDVAGSEEILPSDIPLTSLQIPPCSRSTVSAWTLNSEDSVYAQPTDSAFNENDFAVEADIFLKGKKGYMTLASAGVDGDGDAWALRVENGNAIFAWRDISTSTEWYRLEAENVLAVNDTMTIRAERYGKLTVLYVNGIIKAASESASAIENVNGHFTIGFDPSSETENMPGSVLYVRFDKVRYIQDDFIEERPDSAGLDTDAPLVIDPELSENSTDSTASGERPWIAAWEFDDSLNVGKDYTGNGHDALAGEGKITVKDSVAYFDGSSGLEIPLVSDLQKNSFVVEARIKPTEFGAMKNILVAEPPGRSGDGWMIRVDDGYLTVHFRDENTDYADWNVYTGEKLLLNEWNAIRVERSDDAVKVFQNGVLTIDASYTGDVGEVTYNWGLGYDAMNQTYHDRCFVGYVDYIRFGSLDQMSKDLLESASSYVLLADWEFNAPDFVGLDKIANNTIYNRVGNAKVEDSSLTLDGKSGLYLPLTKTFLRNEFVIDVRLKPKAFGKIQNILVAEPPGRYGDGWMIRIDDGILRIHLRDSQTHSVEWQIFEGKALKADQWTEIRMIRSANALQLYQDNELIVNAAYQGDISQLEYDLSIGFDGMNQNWNERFFEGQIDYIRYYGIRQ